MDYRELFKEENEAVAERYELSMERIQSIAAEESVEQPFRTYFYVVADFICMIGDLSARIKENDGLHAEIDVLKDINYKLYQDILPEHYEMSYANPTYALKQLGEGYGPLLSYLYAELRGEIAFAYESRIADITIINELFIEIYNLFEGEIPEVQSVKDALYWFNFDYCDTTVAYRVRESVDPLLNFASDLILHADLTDLRYLYGFGEYISDSELAIAGFMNSLPQETIDLMADTFTEGYRIGFQVMGRDLSKKKTVMIRYELGFERMIRKVIENYRAMGLTPLFIRAATWSINRNPSRKVGYYSSSPNKQYDYDHRYDSAIYLGKALKDRKLAVMRVAYEEYKKEAMLYAGPCLVGTFGEAGFEPVNKKECLRYNDKQEQISIQLSGESAQLTNEYIPHDEISFTIIAFPVPAIGKDFEEIFKETIVMNTLDYKRYQKMQQIIIDALDQAEYVEILGKGENQTNLSVYLHPLSDAGKQTNFENCVADVNIPLGEVFTSPVLKGTNGVLFVGSVYIDEIQFKNLKMVFRDGMITDYSCDNFSDEQESKNLIKQMIMKNHDSLPMGEFAIGTNTTAYAMAQKFQILDRLPILIVEKMGPHFAVGDTCYCWSEEMAVYNPDGKEIIARDNERSVLRKEDVSKAYFNCHTDITIPYGELGSIVSVKADKTRVPIIENGKFVLPGVEELNKPLT